MSRFALNIASVVLLSFTLLACASKPAETEQAIETGIEVEGIIIRNALTYTVKDVMVEVPATGGFAGCGNILPRSECRTSFQAVDYRQNALRVTWSERGEARGTDEFKVELPPWAKPGDTVWLEVIIYAPGLAGARLIQPDQGR